MGRQPAAPPAAAIPRPGGDSRACSSPRRAKVSREAVAKSRHAPRGVRLDTPFPPLPASFVGRTGLK